MLVQVGGDGHWKSRNTAILAASILISSFQQKHREIGDWCAVTGWMGQSKALHVDTKVWSGK